MNNQDKDKLDISTKKSVKKAADSYNFGNIILAICAIAFILYMIWAIFIN